MTWRSYMAAVVVMLGLAGRVSLAEKLTVEVTFDGPTPNPVAVNEETMLTFHLNEKSHPTVTEESKIKTGPIYTWSYTYTPQVGPAGPAQTGSGADLPLKPKFGSPGRWTVTATGGITYTMTDGVVWSGSDTKPALVDVVRLQIVTPTGASTVNLGESLDLTYTVEGTLFAFDSVELQVLKGTTCIYKTSTGLAKSGQNKPAQWTGAKWNQAPHSGAYANPKNGPYTVRLVGTSGLRQFVSNSISATTTLMIETDLTDDKPTGEISSGLVAPGSGSGIKVGLKLDGGTSVSWASDGVTIDGSPTKQDMDNDGHDEVKSYKLKKEMPSTYADGKYKVAIKGVADVAGNVGPAQKNGDIAGDDGIVDDWAIELW